MARNDLDRNSLYRNSKMNSNNRNNDFDFKSLNTFERKVYIFGDVAFGIFWAAVLIPQAYSDLHTDVRFLMGIAEIMALIIGEWMVIYELLKITDTSLIGLIVGIYSMIKGQIHKNDIDQGLDVKNNIDDIK